MWCGQRFIVWVCRTHRSRQLTQSCLAGVPGFKATNKSAHQRGFSILVHTHHEAVCRMGRQHLDLSAKSWAQKVANTRPEVNQACTISDSTWAQMHPQKVSLGAQISCCLNQGTLQCYPAPVPCVTPLVHCILKMSVVAMATTLTITEWFRLERNWKAIQLLLNVVCNQGSEKYVQVHKIISILLKAKENRHLQHTLIMVPEREAEKPICDVLLLLFIVITEQSCCFHSVAYSSMPYFSSKESHFWATSENDRLWGASQLLIMLYRTNI